MTSRIGDNWIGDLDQLYRLEAFAEDSAFRAEWRRVPVRRQSQTRPIHPRRDRYLRRSQLHVRHQVKRIHEYKRQHLSVLNILTQYHRLKNNPSLDITPRTFLFGGKAAPGYFMAKLIIKLISSVAEVINADPEVNHRIKVVFLPDYNVTFGQLVYPAADLSEQISTAGKEASGTGNNEVRHERRSHHRHPRRSQHRDSRRRRSRKLLPSSDSTPQRSPRPKPQAIIRTISMIPTLVLREVIDSILSGQFSHGDRNLFRPLIDSLIDSDPYLLFADYQSYVDCQDHIGATFLDQESWSRKSIYNTARIGKFSSDRAIHEYCKNIWNVTRFELEPASALTPANK